MKKFLHTLARIATVVIIVLTIPIWVPMVIFLVLLSISSHFASKILVYVGRPADGNAK